MSAPEPNDSIDRDLAAWRLVPKAQPNFRPQVWLQIQARSRPTWVAYVGARSGAWCLAAILTITAAGWAGVAAGRARFESQREAMAVSYLVALDPRVQANLR